VATLRRLQQEYLLDLEDSCVVTGVQALAGLMLRLGEGRVEAVMGLYELRDDMLGYGHMPGWSEA
jgi:hypothetical protein